MKRKPSTDAADEFAKPLSLPKILDGKFYCNIQPHPKTPGGIQATCTTCFGTISGTTKSTGNFLSHIKRRHKDILPSCQLYCSAKNLTCFNQSDFKFHSNFPLTLTTTSSPAAPILLAYTSTAGGGKEPKAPEPLTPGVIAGCSAAGVMPAIPTFFRNETTSSNNTNSFGHTNSSANGVFK